MASSNANVPTPVPFPHPESAQPPQQTSTSNPNSPNSPTTRRSRTSTNASNASSRLRTASIKFMEAAPPPGMWAATGSVTSKAPTLADIRRGSFSTSGWNEEPQRYKAERRASQSDEGGGLLQRRSTNTEPRADQENARPGLGKSQRPRSSDALKAQGVEPFPAVTEEDMNAYHTRERTPEEDISQAPSYESPAKEHSKDGSEINEKHGGKVKERPEAGVRQYSNGYVPPPKVPWKTSTIIGLKGFWKWFLTIPGFLITLYGLNVVAWGGMLFLLLCNASPAMCHPSCNDIQSPRRIWIEIDSQILNALFCVTGFGLAPWRFRDLYWLGVWRLGGSKRKQTGMRRLAGIHRGWFRLPGSDHLPETASATTVSPEDPSVPIPHTTIPDPPPTGIRAPPTKGWKMDFVVWMNVSNTFFQIVLCFYMWHYNRYARPSWATGLFVALGCIVAGVGGIMMFVEGKAVKKVEGVPMPEGGYDNKPTDVEAQSTNAAPVTAVPAEAKK